MAMICVPVVLVLIGAVQKKVTIVEQCQPWYVARIPSCDVPAGQQHTVGVRWNCCAHIREPCDALRVALS